MGRRTPRLIAAVALVLVATSCQTMSGSGHVVTRSIPVTSFSKLEVTGSFTVTVSTGSSEAVSVRIDDNLVDSLDVGVSGETLHVGLKSGTSVTNATLEANVTAPSLDSLEGSGASSHHALRRAWRRMTLTVSLSGASHLAGSVQIDSGEHRAVGRVERGAVGIGLDARRHRERSEPSGYQGAHDPSALDRSVRCLGGRRHRQRIALGKRVGCVNVALRGLADDRSVRDVRRLDDRTADVSVRSERPEVSGRSSTRRSGAPRPWPGAGSRHGPACGTGHLGRRPCSGRGSWAGRA